MNNERIAVLLASGLKAAQVSTIVGISPSRISQLLQEEDFKNLLLLKEADNTEKDIEETAITAKYHAAEHLLLEQITALAPISELRDVVGALKVVADRQDKAKQRINPNPLGGTVIHQNIVNLTLPMQALPQKTIHISGAREVVGINDTELAPMSSTGVTNLFKNLKEVKDGLSQIQREDADVPPIATTEQPILNSLKQRLEQAKARQGEYHDNETTDRSTSYSIEEFIPNA